MTRNMKKSIRDKYIQKAKRQLPVKRPAKRQTAKRPLEEEPVATPPQQGVDGAAPQAIACAKLRYTAKASVAGRTTCVYVNDYTPNRNSSPDGIKIVDESTSQAMKRSAINLTIIEAHGTEAWESCTLIARFSVVDPDDPAKTYVFSTSDQTHCACFNIGLGQDGTPLLSWSQMKAVYRLGDGSIWAEHVDFFDTEDLRAHATSTGRALSGGDEERLMQLHDAELVRVDRIVHSRISNIECDCFVHAHDLPSQHAASPIAENCFFWRLSADPDTLQISTQ